MVDWEDSVVSLDGETFVRAEDGHQCRIEKSKRTGRRMLPAYVCALSKVLDLGLAHNHLTATAAGPGQWMQVLQV